MKKHLYILAIITLTFFLYGCENQEYNNQLREERIVLERQIRNYKEELPNLNKAVSDLKKEKEILKSGHTPKYMIGIKIHQGTFTLDPFEHVKNKLNDITIWMETSESNYKRVKVGDELSGKLKSGSFFIDGDISHLHITICGKEVR